MSSEILEGNFMESNCSMVNFSVDLSVWVGAVGGSLLPLDLLMENVWPQVARRSTKITEKCHLDAPMGHIFALNCLHMPRHSDCCI